MSNDDDEIEKKRKVDHFESVIVSMKKKSLEISSQRFQYFTLHVVFFFLFLFGSLRNYFDSGLFITTIIGMSNQRTNQPVD